ncbi:MAG: ABC transporter ATP-binding protein [Planctomycetota bacterium]|nr:ABC transporter ATP-binding protein [Planctomycetota bacterium]
MSLDLQNLRVSYGAVRALDGVTVKIEPGEMFFLLGPSGCGKSTLLRSVAGFIEEFDGDIRIGSESLKGVPPHRRDFGMVFQNYALFPHLTVFGNVAFGLEARGVASAEIKTRVTEALKLVGLSGYEERRPGELSGGQQQRVALARALVIRPRVLLLDEPLSNLDAKLRWEMRSEIKRIHAQTRITTLYVTHDQKEALSLADRMAILKDGKIEALGRPRDLYWNPPSRFAAGFLGDLNELQGTLGADAMVKTALGEIAIPSGRPEGVSASGTVTVFCRPESVALAAAEGGALPAGHAELTAGATVAGSAFLGEYTLYEIDLPGGARWRSYRHEGAGAGLSDGAKVRVGVADGSWRVVP